MLQLSFTINIPDNKNYEQTQKTVFTEPYYLPVNKELYFYYTS